MSSKKEQLEQEIVNNKLAGCINEEHGRLKITDSKETGNESVVEGDFNAIDSNAKVLVHCTDLFPRDNMILSSYDGNKILTAVPSYHGVTKNVQALFPRHEVHFTVNNRVESTSAGEGNWDNPKYIIVDSLRNHENELEHVDPSDTWTKGVSIKLSEDAVILADIKCKNELPFQINDSNEYNVIYYDGDATTCLRNFLRVNGYDIFHTEINDPSHSRTWILKQERGAWIRNVAINFVKDNIYYEKFDGKNDVSFTGDAIAQIVDVALKGMTNTKLPAIVGQQQLELLGNTTTEYRDLVNFVISSGLVKKENGQYTFKCDDEILSNIVEWEKAYGELPECADVDLINEIYDMQQQFAKRYMEERRPMFSEISEMPLTEIFEFKNQINCEVLANSLPENRRIIGNGVNEVILQMNLEGKDIKKRIDARQMRMKVSDISKSFEDFEKELMDTQDKKQNDINEK